MSAEVQCEFRPVIIPQTERWFDRFGVREAAIGRPGGQQGVSRLPSTQGRLPADGLARGRETSGIRKARDSLGDPLPTPRPRLGNADDSPDACRRLTPRPGRRREFFISLLAESLPEKSFKVVQVV